MRLKLTALIALFSMLLAACGGGGDQQTGQATTAPTSAAQATTAAGATPTTGPATTAGTPTPGAMTGATATAGPLGMATPPMGATATGGPLAEGTVAVPTDGATAVAAEPTQEGTPAAEATSGPGLGAKGSGPDAKLALPSALLKKHKLKYFGGTGEETAEAKRYLTKYNGKRVVDNLWFGDVQRAKGLFLVADTRYQFESTDGASGFLKELQAELKRSARGQRTKVKDLSNQVKLGDEDFMLLGTSATGQEGSAYVIGFRRDKMVAYILLAGGKTMKDKEAIEIARAADKKLQEDL